MPLSDYEKAMLIMKRAQLRFMHVMAVTEQEEWGPRAAVISADMDRQLREVCGFEVLRLVSPPAEPSYSNG